MSVSIGLGFSKQKNQIHPYQQLFRNILERLDSIQGHQAKPYLKTSLIDPNGYKEFEKIEQKMKIIISSNVQNLRMVEENMKQNIEQLYQKVRHFENKIIRTLKEKQEVLQYLQYRVGSVESSQKNVTQFMKKVSENQSEKYSGVPILEERMRQMQHLFELKNLKTTDHMKIWHEQLSMEINKNMKLLNQKIDRNKQQSNENRLNWKQKNQISQNPKQQIRQLKRKIQIVQIQMREQILKCAQLQSSLKEFTENTQRTLNKISKQQRQIKQYEQSLKNKQAAVKPKFNTQGHESDLNLEQKKNNIFSKKTETEQKSSLFPTKTTKNQINNPRHFLGATTSRGEQSNPDSEKNNKVYHLDESDQDPFQNMVGGIRGLLKKSKEKQVKYDSKKKLNENIEKKKPLPRQQKLGELIHESPKNYLMNKNLPPVKGDLRKNNRPSYINSEQNQEQEQVYQVDQDGFLLDEQGNYLYDQDGNRVQIEEQMYDLIEDRR